jgi:hypothetical protein
MVQPWKIVKSFQQGWNQLIEREIQFDILMNISGKWIRARLIIPLLWHYVGDMSQVRLSTSCLDSIRVETIRPYPPWLHHEDLEDIA